MSLTSFASEPLLIDRQGQFPVRGITIECPGIFDPDTFTDWTNPVQDGQTYRCDHASRPSNAVAVKPVADEEFWFDIWRRFA